MSGETISLSSSGNITMLVFNGIEEDCSYDKWERRLKCGLELKDVAYVLEDDFVVPTKLEADEDVSDEKKPKKRYEDNIKAKVLIKIATDDIDLICDMPCARETKKILDNEFKLGDKDYDLDNLTHQFEEASLDIKSNPSVFFTNLTKINKKFANSRSQEAKIMQGMTKKCILKCANVSRLNIKRSSQPLKLIM